MIPPQPASPQIAEVVENWARLSDFWQSYMSSLQFYTQPIGDNGTTANRPTSNLYVGRQYFDTTLGFPVFVKTVNPAVWVRYDGTVV